MTVIHVYTPFPAALLVASMHAITDVVHPLHLYPYLVVLLRPPPDVVLAMVVLLSAWRVCDDVGWRAGLGLALLGAAVYMAQGGAALFGVLTVYYCCVHTPLHYMKRARARAYMALFLATVLTAICTKAAFTMPMSRELSFGPLAQCLFASHLLVERSKGRWMRRGW